MAERAGDVDGTLEALSTLVAFGDSDRKRVLREIGRQRKFVPVTVRENLGWEDVARIEVNALDLPGVAIEDGAEPRVPVRHDAVAHVLGYVAPVSEAERGGDPLLAAARLSHRQGRHREELRAGRCAAPAAAPKSRSTPSAASSASSIARKAMPGADLTLTLDLDLQRLAVERLGTESGAAVVLDVDSGDVLAMASTPATIPAPSTAG